MEKFTLRSDGDGLLLYGFYLVPEGRVKGIVQISHGMAEHKERYLPFMEFLKGEGYVSVIHDHRGHGESVKEKGHYGYFYEDGAKNVVEDVKKVTLFIKEKFQNLPLILFGHSMGSLIVREYVKNYDALIDGLIVCGSPGENKLAGMGRFLCRLLEKRFGPYHRSALIQAMAFGSFVKPFEKEGSVCAWICSDQEVVKAYEADEKCGFTFTLNGFISLFTLMKQAYSQKGWGVQNPSLPIYFISGSEDPCRGGDKTFLKGVLFLKGRGYKDVEWKEYALARHEILNETCKNRVYRDVLSWIADKA